MRDRLSFSILFCSIQSDTFFPEWSLSVHSRLSSCFIPVVFFSTLYQLPVGPAFLYKIHLVVYLFSTSFFPFLLFHPNAPNLYDIPMSVSFFHAKVQRLSGRQVPLC